MSEQVAVIFKVLGRKRPTRKRKRGKGNSKHDLLIQPMMELPKP